MNQRNKYITLSENHIFSPQILNTARFSLSRTMFSSIGILRGLPANPSIVPGFPVGELQVAGYDHLGPIEPLSSGTQNICAFSDDINFTRGKHALRLQDEQ